MLWQSKRLQFYFVVCACVHLCMGARAGVRYNHLCVIVGRTRGDVRILEITRATGSHWRPYSTQRAQSAAARVRRQHDEAFISYGLPLGNLFEITLKFVSLCTLLRSLYKGLFLCSGLAVRSFA